ncbi:MAG: type II toxin-antitoxin system VapC family toxin [Methylohalobius sp.]|nr:type II toxin-antitoxin system VapC family toxin [Methylohalobius sp.]
MLAIEPEHVLATEQLPWLHQDPFDRLLIAQAIVEPMHLITHDKKIAAYHGPILYV